MSNIMKIMLPLLIFAFCLSFIGCNGSGKNYPVEFVARNAVFASDKKPKPLRLVVEIDENGRLSLNKIETGTIRDLTGLNGKLQVVFEDREKAGIREREVVIDPQGNIKNEDMEKLIESLAAAKAAPIRIIKND